MPAQTIRQRLEITYDYHPTKGHCREHWMYVEVSGKTIEECYEKGRKHFQTQMKALGWTKITTLTNVGPLKKVNDVAPKKPSTDTESSSGKSSNGNSKRGQRTTTGDRRNTRTSKRRVKKSN